MGRGHEADHSNDAPPPVPFFDPRKAIEAALIAVVTYLAVAAAQKPGVTEDQLHDHDKRLALLEQMASEQKELNAELRDYLRRRR